MQKQFRLKAEGPKPQLLDLIKNLKNFYVIIPTSGYIEHPDSEECHIYLTVVEVR